MDQGVSGYLHRKPLLYCTVTDLNSDDDVIALSSQQCVARSHWIRAQRSCPSARDGRKWDFIGIKTLKIILSWCISIIWIIISSCEWFEKAVWLTDIQSYWFSNLFWIAIYHEGEPASFQLSIIMAEGSECLDIRLMGTLIILRHLCTTICIISVCYLTKYKVKWLQYVFVLF